MTASLRYSQASRWLRCPEFWAPWMLVIIASIGLGIVAGARPAPPVPRVATSAELKEADTRVRSMDQEQLFELRRKRDTFYALPPAQQAAMRDLYQQIQAHPHAERLMTVLKRFYSWYRGLDPIIQPKILDETDLEKRVTAIQQLMRDQSRDSNALPFSNRDLEVVEKWVDDFARERSEEIKKIANKLAEDTSNNSNVNQMVRMMFRGEIAPAALFRRLINFAFVPGRANPQLLDIVKDEDLAKLFASFSSEGQSMVPEGREARLRLLLTLVRRPYASEEDLHKFYVQELTAEQRDSLDRMPPERMNRELRQLYIQKKYQLPGRRGGFGPPPRN
jgi:hypothetical protein